MRYKNIHTGAVVEVKEKIVVGDGKFAIDMYVLDSGVRWDVSDFHVHHVSVKDGE